ncbi:MAG: polysaccharide deacetylase family protein [Gracilibacteraceae bacterium]|jgi:peptidoglycan/xylan/chitin deacetylase (PgdA/CDA1 family)|nr:polysaccharide deacetylase family protein [Gracilibacteraceae bacterium]
MFRNSHKNHAGKTIPLTVGLPKALLLFSLPLCVFLILSACAQSQEPTAPQPPPPADISTDIDIIPQTEAHDHPASGAEPTPPDEIYEIAGTSPGVTGQAWQNMTDWRRQSVQYAAQHRGRLYINANTSTGLIYLTFDDGPGSQNTPQIINILREHNIAATFFCTGKSMEAHPEIIKQLAGNGFAIGLHGWDHKRFTAMSETELIHQIEQSNELLHSLTGRFTTITRPPYGDINETVIETLAAQNQKVFLWSIDTMDWAQKDPQDVLRNIQDNLRPGDIILMHCGDGQPLTARILPDIIQYIRDQGYLFGQL